MTVTFAGSNRIMIGESDLIYVRLKKTLEELIAEGADTFLLGGCDDFEKLAAMVLKILKSDYPHIKTVLVIPYKHLQYVDDFYDEYEYPDLGQPETNYVAVTRRNWYMLSKSDCLVTCVVPSLANIPNREERLVAYAMKNYKNMKIKSIFK